jgi:K+-sensing histidine kinase KdpD
MKMKALSKLQRYGLATISCGIAFAVAWPIDAPVSCFLLAVMVSSLFGGLGPGLFSVGLTPVSFVCFFLQRTPRQPWNRLSTCESQSFWAQLCWSLG